MRHHFADFLDRKGGYWTIVPNIRRYAYASDKPIKNKDRVKILTISKTDKYWEQIFECPNIEEVTLHNASKEQINAISTLASLTRLRLTHLRTPDINFITPLQHVRELVLEYVSGFSDLSPLAKLKNLSSLHLENLRGVKSFDGLHGIKSLRFLHIDGTIDRNQPIHDFGFLGGLPSLEVLELLFVSVDTPYPAFLSAAGNKMFKKIRMGRTTIKQEEYAFLETAFPKAKCVTFDDVPWKLYYKSGDYYEFLGKRAGKVAINGPQTKERIKKEQDQYEEAKRRARELIQKNKLKLRET